LGQTKPIAQPQVPNKSVFYLLAGPDGAGKSTLYKALVVAGTIAAETQTEHQSHCFYFRKRPGGAFHDSQLSGFLVQLQSEAVRRIPLRALM
jgi:hypothetical protein